MHEQTKFVVIFLNHLKMSQTRAIKYQTCVIGCRFPNLFPVEYFYEYKLCLIVFVVPESVKRVSGTRPVPRVPVTGVLFARPSHL